MDIRFVSTRDAEGFELLCPTFFCDTCGEPVADASLGRIVFPTDSVVGPWFVVHQGACHNAIDQQLGERAPWHHLSVWLSQLCVTAGMSAVGREHTRV